VTTRRRAVVALVVGLAGLMGAAACGVEVPDDVAADLRETTTTTDAATTTELPTSDDELEQALIDNGYSIEESRCGAENLRAALDEDELQTIIDAGSIEDISASTARAFADAIQPCVEDGGAPGTDPGEEPPDDDGPGLGGGMPDFGDDSEGDVSRSRFLAALIAGGVPDEQARCIVEELYADLDQEDINALFHADSEAGIPDDLLDAFMTIVEGCE